MKEMPVFLFFCFQQKSNFASFFKGMAGLGFVFGSSIRDWEKFDEFGTLQGIDFLYQENQNQNHNQTFNL